MRARGVRHPGVSNAPGRAKKKKRKADYLANKAIEMNIGEKNGNGRMWGKSPNNN